MEAYRSIFAPGLLRGQVAIVTGGGCGIGRCTAHEIAALGAHVVIIGRKAEKLAAVQAEIEAAGGICETHVCDIREEAQVKATVAGDRRAARPHRRAGQQRRRPVPAPLAAISAKGFDAVVRNNLTGGFLIAREASTSGC